MLGVRSLGKRLLNDLSEIKLSLLDILNKGSMLNQSGNNFSLLNEGKISEEENCCAWVEEDLQALEPVFSDGVHNEGIEIKSSEKDLILS